MIYHTFAMVKEAKEKGTGSFPSLILMGPGLGPVACHGP
jgi:hypothetical protein